MKKIIALVLAIACILTISACNQKENEDILHLGINAEIVEIDTDNQIVYIVDFGEEKVFGARCGIDCKQLIIDQEILYVDYDTEGTIKDYHENLDGKSKVGYHIVL